MQRHPMMPGGPTPGGPQDLRKDRHEPMTDPRAGLPFSRPRSGDPRDPRDLHDMREGRDPRGLPGREYEVQVSCCKGNVQSATVTCCYAVHCKGNVQCTAKVTHTEYGCSSLECETRESYSSLEREVQGV